jgi:hypothetical protein
MILTTPYFAGAENTDTIPPWAIRGWLIQYPDIHHCRRGDVSSNSVIVITIKFAAPHKSRMCHYIIKLAQRGQTIDP